MLSKREVKGIVAFGLVWVWVATIYMWCTAPYDHLPIVIPINLLTTIDVIVGTRAIYLLWKKI